MKVAITTEGIVVTLSERNLRTGLHKLQMPGSARTLERGALVLKFETDAEHYADREPPGEMHPATERHLQGADSDAV